MSTETEHEDRILENEEINRLYPDQWVLVEDPEMSSGFGPIRGYVRWHGPSREGCFEARKAAGYGVYAMHYTGEPPKDVVFFF